MMPRENLGCSLTFQARIFMGQYMPRGPGLIWSPRIKPREEERKFSVLLSACFGAV